MIPIPATSDPEQICDAFENAWRSAGNNEQSSRPELAAYFAHYSGDNRERLLFHLLELEIDYRRRAGETIERGTYLAEFPEFAPAIDRAISQASAEETEAPGAPGTQPNRRLAPRAPNHLGPYELLGELGRGGMGIVYRARQLSLNRLVALKLIRSGERADAEELSRFRREAEAAAALEHPAIVPVYEVGEDQGFVYFSMGLVEGGSLAERVAELPLPAQQAAAYVEAIARGVDYAHQQGVIHRDLKPANILLDKQNQPKITDFGLAKRLQDDNDLTTTGQVLGTPAYMPPEQARGDLSQIGPAGDIYSLGAILYRLLTGRAPFQAASLVDTLHAVIDNDPVPPRRLAPELAADLETICLKCLEKQPHKRYPTAGELAADLRRWQAGEPIHARRATLIERAWKWARRNPVVAVLSGSLALALVIGTTVATLFGMNAHFVSKQERAARIQAQQETKRANEAVEALKKEKAEVIRQKNEVQKRIERELKRADTTIYAMTLGQAANELAQRNLPAAEQTLNRTEPAFRGWEFTYLQRQANRLLREVPLRGLQPKHFTFSHDERFLAAIDGQDQIHVLDLQSGEIVARHQDTPWRKRDATPIRSPYPRVYFSRDDRLLVWHDEWRIKGWDWRENRVVFCLDTPQRPTTLTMSRTDDRFAVGFSLDDKLAVYRLPSGELVKELPQEKGTRNSYVALSADGQQLITLDYTEPTETAPQVAYSLSLHPLTGEEPTRRAVPDLKPLGTGFELSPDDKFLLLKDGQRIEVASGQLLGSFTGHNTVAKLIDSQRICSVADFRNEFTPCTARIWDLAQQQQLLSLPLGNPAAEVVSPSGDILGVVQQDKLQLWNIAIRSRDTFEHTMTAGLAWYPDSERLLAIGSDGVVEWNARTRQLTSRVLTPGQSKWNITALAFSPGHNLLATSTSKLGDRKQGDVSLWDVKTWKPLHVWPQGSMGVALHPGGKWLVANSGTRLVLRDSETYEDVRSFPWGFDFDFSPDGRWLAINPQQGAAEIWDLQAKSEQPTHQIRWNSSYSTLKFTPDSQRLLFVDENHAICSWSLEKKQVERRLPGHGYSVSHLSFSPDGSRLVSLGGFTKDEVDGEIKLWDFEAGVGVLNLPQAGWWPRVAAFSPDGKRLAVGGQAGRVHIWSVP